MQYRKTFNDLIDNEVNIQDAPQYILSFSVGIIPYVINRFTKAINPVKLYEYSEFSSSRTSSITLRESSG